MEVKPTIRRFSCTQCGMCCNRSPEVLLSEASALSDIFVFRMMFRLYWLPQRVSDYRPPNEHRASSSAQFFEKKRLLNAFAARKYPVKVWRDGKRIAHTKYLLVSALTLDTNPGACRALRDKQCGIYERRPLSCRSVPLHYSHAEVLAEAGLKAFVETPGYRCDTSETASVILEDGRIVAPEFKMARSEALAVAEDDRRWGEAIIRRMPTTPSAVASLPTLQEIESNAQLGVMTASMRVAWQIAAEIGMIRLEERDTLVERQLGLINQELAERRCSVDTRQTLSEMQAEYRSHLTGGVAVAIGG